MTGFVLASLFPVSGIHVLHLVPCLVFIVLVALVLV